MNLLQLLDINFYKSLLYNPSFQFTLIIGLISIIIFIRFVLSKSLEEFPKKKNSYPLSLFAQSDPQEIIQVRILNKIQNTHDSYIFRFELHGEDQELGINLGDYVRLHVNTKENKTIQRTYTVISDIKQRGHFDILIKIYLPNEQFFKGGKMTKILHTLEPGQYAGVSGPVQKWRYQSPGIFYLRDKKAQTEIQKQFTRLVLIAGGTGICPMYKLIRHIHNTLDDFTKIYLFFGNKTENDILLKDHLENYREFGKLKIFYYIDKLTDPSKDQPIYKKGYITAEDIKILGPKNNLDLVYYIYSGPKEMNQAITKILLENLKINQNNILKL